MKNVLIPTDFSENSWRAICYGMSFLKDKECKFYLLHVLAHHQYIHGDNMYNSALAVKSIATNEHIQMMEALVTRIKNQFLNSKHTIETVFETTFFVDGIRKQIEEHEVDLIIMGTKGATGLKELTVGSNTGDVITKVKCPVLVVPEDANYSTIKEIVFPTDYNIYYKSRIIDTITEVVNSYRATLHVLHVAKKEKELTELQLKNKDYLDDSLEDIKHSFHFLSHENIEQAVQSFVENREIDLITMVAKNLNFFQRILFRPLVEKITYHTKIPFLILHE